ncbi:hypothetical protein PspTeo4_19144 [Pseudomonas sp. Teo4]|nr:hypothetical protein [Pseudomonas sp. Teo4]
MIAVSASRRFEDQRHYQHVGIYTYFRQAFENTFHKVFLVPSRLFINQRTSNNGFVATCFGKHHCNIWDRKYIRDTKAIDMLSLNHLTKALIGLLRQFLTSSGP